MLFREEEIERGYRAKRTKETEKSKPKKVEEFLDKDSELGTC